MGLGTGGQDGELDRAGGTRSEQVPACSFCGQVPGPHQKILAGRDAHICDACAVLAASLLTTVGQATTATTTATAAMVKLDSHAVGQRCSFCRKPFYQVAGLAAAGDARICVECLELCQDVFAEEPA